MAGLVARARLRSATEHLQGWHRKGGTVEVCQVSGSLAAKSAATTARMASEPLFNTGPQAARTGRKQEEE